MPKGVYKHKSHKVSDETKLKMSKAKKGQLPWITGKHWSEEKKEEFSKARLEKKKKNGYLNSPETRLKMSLAKKGKKIVNRKKPPIFTEEHRKRMSESRTGEKHWRWKGGPKKIITAIRISFKYRQWRSDVFTRDNFTCQDCGERGGRLQVHHIKPLSTIIEENNIKTLEEAMNCEEIWNINNGITLCLECHKKTDSYLKRTKKIIIINK